MQMLDFINKFFRREESSKTQAKERLRLVLMSDRVSLAPDVFDSMKSEMLTVVRRYLDIDERGLDVHFENAERQFMLLANIPVLKVKPLPQPANGSGSGNGSLLLEAPVATRPRRRRRRRKHNPNPQPQTPAPPDTELPPEAQPPL
jgi:cell division topological specificity factor